MLNVETLVNILNSELSDLKFDEPVNLDIDHYTNRLYVSTYKIKGIEIHMSEKEDYFVIDWEFLHSTYVNSSAGDEINVPIKLYATSYFQACTIIKSIITTCYLKK